MRRCRAEAKAAAAAAARFGRPLVRGDELSSSGSFEMDLPLYVPPTSGLPRRRIRLSGTATRCSTEFVLERSCRRELRKPLFGRDSRLQRTHSRASAVVDDCPQPLRQQLQ